MVDLRAQTSFVDEDAQGDGRFKLLLDTLPHMAFAIFSDGQAEYFNQAFITYHGFRPGPGMAARAELVHPDDRAGQRAAREAGVAGSGEYVVEVRLLRHDGAYRWHRIENKPVVRAGQRIGYVGTAVDIHDAKLANEVLEQRVAERTAALAESEARYRTLYNRTPMALHSVDQDGRLIDVNDTWTELFGWSREEAVGRAKTDFMTPQSAEHFRQHAWPEMLASDGRMLSTEYCFMRRDGSLFDGRLSARGEFDAEGRFVRSWSATEDITAQKRAERELRQAQRMEAIGQLTSGIAHDFNNLITAISGNLELLVRKAQLDPRWLRLVEGAQTAAARGAKLTGQLLAFSRQQRISVDAIDLNALIGTMCPLLQSSIGATVQIELALEPGLGPALADPTQLELAVLNLAINARDAMEGGGVLTIRTGTAERAAPVRPEEPPAGTYVTVSVADTGPGIPAPVRERIFEPFFTTKEAGKGSGLGLPHVLGVIQQLGGGVEVRSAPGEGTCVTLFLPPAAATQARPSTQRPAPPRQPELARRLKLMLVDDDPAVLEVTAEMLREEGNDVETFGSGAEALAALAAVRPDVLVADVAMPGMNGVELAAAARQAQPGLKVLFITGFAEERVLPTQSGEQVLRKPFRVTELAARVAGLAGSG